MKKADFSDLLGLTLTAVHGTWDGSELVLLETSNGRRFRMLHYESCCERVQLADVAGDVADLLDGPLLQAECVTNEGGEPAPEHGDSWTWTFYKLATNKGAVTLRWLGESNGYYSESVDFEELEEGDA